MTVRERTIFNEFDTNNDGVLDPDELAALMAAQETAVNGVVARSPVAPRGEPVTFEVLRIDLRHLMKIDQIEQTFRARLFLQLVIKDGQHDADLMFQLNARAPEFRLRPSATWLLHQLHFPNAVSVDYHERKVTKMGKDDLHLILRFDGTFLQHFNLHDLPYDSQHLHVQLASHCAHQGVSPIRFVWRRQQLALLSGSTQTFLLKDVWNLHSQLRLHAETLAPSPGRTYPAISIGMTVQRRPGYFLMNVVFPMASFVLMGFGCFAIEVDDVGGRLEYLGAIVLTCAAYKLTISSSVPAVAYVTFLDLYVIACMTLCILLVFETALVRHSGLDDLFLMVFIAAFSGLQVWFCYQAGVAIPRRERELLAAEVEVSEPPTPRQQHEHEQPPPFHNRQSLGVGDALIRDAASRDFKLELR